MLGGRLVRFSIVIKIDKKQLGEKMVYFILQRSGHSSSLREARARIQSRNLGVSK